MNDEQYLEMLKDIADRGLPFAIDIVDDSAGTGRCYLDLINTNTDICYRLEFTRVD